MSLNPEGLAMIHAGSKKVEVRLYDEKRQKIKVGDMICFTSTVNADDTLKATVADVRQFSTFAELYDAVGLEALGRSDKTMQWMLEETEKLYDKERETKYGALAIYIDLR
ncbi:MAG: ASCH domain-containing protein [Bacteroidetes bacterium]|nr:ASCH domain-containing protein [Bacteroidota bacterium]